MHHPVDNWVLRCSLQSDLVKVKLTASIGNGEKPLSAGACFTVAVSASL